jgi:hypothetical protein
MRRAIKRFCRHHKMAVTVSQIIFTGWLAMMIIWCVEGYQINAQAAEAFSNLSSTQATQLVQVTQSWQQDEATLADIRAEYPHPTTKDIDAYIKTIFGKDAPTATGIAHHECWTWSKQFPGCQHLSDAEDSIGIFQINLHNKTQNIHAARIPGGNMTQKEDWLRNPFNNTLYAFWIYRTSGFSPWSTFTSGAYLR